MRLNVDRPSIGPISGVVILTTLATAAIHLYLVPEEFDKGATGYGTLFVLTGVGYLAALAVMYVPWPRLSPLRGLARLVIVGIALAAIIAYLVLEFFDTLGWVTKAIEAVLVIAAVGELATIRGDRDDARSSNARQPVA